MPIKHVVGAGEGISSIGMKYGFAPHTLWEAAENATLRELRRDGDILLPGDVVHVPDRRPRDEACATGKHHRFRRRGVPAFLQIQLYRDGEPRRDEPFELYVDEAFVVRGRTDRNGVVRARVSPAGKKGRLVLGDEGQETVMLALGGLHPITEISGVQQRLRQLGFFRKSPDGQPSSALTRALRAFQRHTRLPESGEADAATREKLAALHDGTSELGEIAESGAR